MNQFVFTLAILGGLFVGGPAAVAQCPASGSCVAVHSASGCDSADCCNAVCALDPTCCTMGWDAGCVSLANLSCVGYCGASVNGSCYTAHANPACDNATCCTAVCNLDPFCCEKEWDLTCTQFAGFSCQGTPGTCGVTPDSCFTAHSQGACSDAPCCNAVCSIDATCCSQSWDAICVTIANQTCVSGCTPVAETGAIDEVELCDERSNDPCYVATGGTPQSLAPNVQLKGTLGRGNGSANGVDVDVFRVVIPDSDGDGLARVSLQFASSPAAWVALVAEGACPAVTTSIIHLSSSLCVDSTSPAQCIPVGTYRVIVGAGTYPAFAGTDIACTGANRYTLKVTAAQTCTPCTASAPSCFLPHTNGGCNSPSCCTAVCSTDPFCCDSSWDEPCVASAATLCLSGPPAYDTCAGAATVSVGTFTLNTARAGLELPQLTSCGASATYARDVWCTYVSDRTGTMELRSCGSWFDTVIAAYTGGCGSLTAIACNDDGSLCPGVGASRLAFQVQCGQRYYFRVGPKSGQGGDVVLTLSNGQSTACPACPADLNHSGAVDSQDISIMLNAWGTTAADLSGDGVTNSADIAVLLNAWGPCF